MTSMVCAECGHLWFEEGGVGKCVHCGGQGKAQRPNTPAKGEIVAECQDCPAVRIFQGNRVTFEKPRPLSEWQAAIHRRLGHKVRWTQDPDPED